MKNINIKYFTSIAVFISGIIFYIIARIKHPAINDVASLYSVLSNVVTIDCIIFAIFVKWGWKVRILQGWLVPYPDLNGTWTGEIQSNWINQKTQAKLAPIPVMLSIKQSFLSISCVMRTSEMVSYSYAESFKIDTERQIKQLVYSYMSKPNLSVVDRSPSHDGTIVFDIVGDADNSLNGQYWTARLTTGQITLTFNKTRQSNQLTAALKKHPMSGVDSD